MNLHFYHLPLWSAFLASGLLFASGSPTSCEAETVTVQLKWHHQFQFAGYYAAQKQGFFTDEGLEVNLIEGGVDRPPLETVLSGRADLGVSDADVLQARMKGVPIVVLASIFQHSPYILMSRRDSGIRVPADLIDRTIMVSSDQGAAQNLAIFKNEGLPIDRIRFVSHTWNLDSLISGEIDAISAYITAEPSQMLARGIEPQVIKASDYGVDFYGDTLFTREEYAKNHPQKVAAMIRATRRGWQYAMANREELIAHILTLSGVRERGITHENLRYEADAMDPLICADLVEIGHMNPDRWLRMSQAFLDTGVAPHPSNHDWFQGFLYEETSESRDLKAILPFLVAATGLALAALLWSLTLRRQVEQRTREIQRGNELRKHLIESALDGVIGINRDDNVVYWNGSAAKLFNIDEKNALGFPVARFIPGLRKRLKDSGNSPDEHRRFVFEAKRNDGSAFPVELSVSKLAPGLDVTLNLFVRDLTEQRRLEEQLRQSQKMQAIGQLAGGVAHDFNNLLTVIRGNAGLVAEELEEEDEARHSIDEIISAGDRAASLTSQLLAFSRQRPLQRAVFEGNKAVVNFSRMLERLIGEDVTIELQLCDDSVFLNADQAMFDQVLLNLAVNGRDAMPRGGTLTLTTSRIEAGPGSPELPSGTAPGEYFRIEVADDGEGIAPEHISRLFEPFFTTKGVGKGTGLGLATVFGIVEQHQGWVSVESRQGEGSRFAVSFPVCNEPALDASPSHRHLAPGGSETIFLVEDESMVRHFARRLLVRHGYRVIEAHNGLHALDLWEKHAGEIDLLLTDVVMPGGVAGTDLARLLTEARPDLKVIFTSGYAADIFRGEIDLPSEAAFISKPYPSEELLRILRQILDDSFESALALPS
ncbi:MAG: ABC transporter substrate-binding protein [Verrucomicrobiae bacterium]|nr:ABC transporter substrate-binding protein [Verrucomicrobiae bacterium]